MKKEIREVALGKEEAGYKAQYFYVDLKEMQNVFTRLELKYFLTSRYTEETRVVGESTGSFAIRNIARRDLVDITTGTIIASTEIDITNLKQLSDPYGIGKDVLRISEPRDAWKTLFLDFFEPQNLGAISTYFQRYTYNQLYDFQETKGDPIEKKGKLEGKVVIKKDAEEEKEETTPTEKTPKEKRLQDDAAKQRTRIKKEFTRDNIIEALNGRKLGTMNSEEVEAFYKEMTEKYTKKIEGEE
ncbi:MAG: hypothetical protein EOM19_02145 [Candidatus Moranbacteria bacterium]|nr:hypothetical protein [Candidatus Moranbacteria bacterium]